MCLCLVLMVLQAAIFIALRSQFAHLFTTDESIVRNIGELLPLTLLFSFIDSHQATLTGILVGVGKQAIAAPICLFCYWIVGVPLGAALAFGAFGIEKQGLTGLWTGMLVGVILHTLLFGFIVAFLRWPLLAEAVRKRVEEERLQGISECGNSGLDRSLVGGSSQGESRGAVCGD